MIILKIIASVCLFVLINLIGSYDYRLESIVAEIIYSVLLIKINEKNNFKDFFILLFPIILIEGFVRIFNFEDTFFSLPPFIFKLLPFIIFLLFRTVKSIKYAFIANIILTIIFNIFFYNNWLNYVNQGTFTGKLEKNKTKPFNLISFNFSKDTLKINSKSGIKIIDFWTESCGICYKKFPKYSELKNNYYANKNVTFITGLNSKGNNYKQIASKIDSTFNFKTYLISDEDCKNLAIFSYPTILVFNNNSIIFRGSVETLEPFLKSEDFQNLNMQ